jgi:hypothetical protein
MLLVSIIAIVALLAVWTRAWQRRPALAFGMFLGVLGVWVIATLIRPSGLAHIPLWLPPLPFAIVAVALFSFGALAWVWGRHERS